MRASIVGLAFSTAPGDARYVPLGTRARCGDDRNVPLADVLDALGPVLEDPPIAKVGHDLKFDTIVLARHGVTLRGVGHRHDDRQLPARRDAVGHDSKSSALEHAELQGADRGGRLRPRREGGRR